MGKLKIPKKFRSKKIKWGWISLSALIFFIVILASATAFFEIKYNKSFYPGVKIAGEDVSGKSYAEILQHFQERVDLINKNGAAFNIISEKGTIPVQIPTFSNGLTTDKVVEYFSLDDWENVVKTAYSVGRKGNLWQRIKEQYESFANAKNFIFSPVIQKEAINSFLQNELDDSLIKAAPAEFAINEDKLSILPEVIGEKLDTEKAIFVLEKKLDLLDTSTSELKAEKDAPSVTAQKLQAFSDFAEKLRHSLSINFHYDDYSWEVDGDTLATWLTIKQNDKIGIDEQKLQDFFNKTAILYIDSPMQNSRFEMQDNKLVEISQGNAGNIVDVGKNAQNIDNIISGMAENLNTTTDISDNKNNTVDVSIETTQQEPEITKETIDQYKIKELAGSATTDFEGGSSDRQHNIEVGVSKLNGILLAPGEEFSAVNGIGDVTEEAGFVKEYVIDNGKTQKEVGGGLCQVATTLFRLALNTGLPIAERVNHLYVISYYGAGLDATIYGPHPDLRFINDTGNYLLLQGKTENNKVTFEFYGKKDGRTVTISKPKIYDTVLPPPTKFIPTDTLATGKIKCSEIAHNGVTADVTYTVSWPDGETKSTNFHSVYEPWQKVCMIGS